jgi:hypothetical protein
MSFDHRQLWLFERASATLSIISTEPKHESEMGELTEARWAVLSEHGCEAFALTYAQATEMIRALTRERVSGLSIITDDAAHRAAPNAAPYARRSNSNGTGRKTKIKS